MEKNQAMEPSPLPAMKCSRICKEVALAGSRHAPGAWGPSAHMGCRHEGSWSSHDMQLRACCHTSQMLSMDSCKCAQLAASARPSNLKTAPRRTGSGADIHADVRRTKHVVNGSHFPHRPFRLRTMLPFTTTSSPRRRRSWARHVKNAPITPDPSTRSR